MPTDRHFVCRITCMVLGLAGAMLAQASEPVVISQASITLLHDVQISAPEAGRLSELSVREGDRVQLGDRIASLDDELQRLESAVARQQWEIARVEATNDINRRYAVKQHKVAEAELARSENATKLFPKSISRAELEELRLVSDRALLSIEQADLEQEMNRLTENLRDSELAFAEARLARRQIHTPLDGMVVDVIVEQGEWLAQGAPIARIIQLQTLRVEALVDHRVGTRALTGKSMRVIPRMSGSEADEQRSYLGRIEFVSPEVEPVTGQVRIWGTVQNPDEILRPGELVSLELID